MSIAELMTEIDSLDAEEQTILYTFLRNKTDQGFHDTQTSMAEQRIEDYENGLESTVSITEVMNSVSKRYK